MAAKRAASSLSSLLRSPPAAGSVFRSDLQHYGIITRSSYTTCSSLGIFKVGHILPAAHLTSLRRFASSQPAGSKDGPNKISIGPKKEEIEDNTKDERVVYEGPISSIIKKVKLLSLSTCCLSVSLGPVITFMTSPDMNVILKGAVASTVIFLSASTTAALHWFVSPYIHKIRWQPGSPTFEAEMLSWMATPIPRTVKFADVRPAETNRPYVTFEAGGDFYFVDAEHFHNKALLARLTPQKSSHGSAFKNL